ncbi:hypothetical protein [Anaerocolumna sp. MB42-C2]|uniref:hypothetical protein n=1 Tax=Anaerocolumna sp. MB42-C2 TaxID=3070997 RepID=UPI0027DF3561|nr:hypothetical protein [Anaerocolumna sp. MB42-C2]WMJ90135.1 hypothetical protein RBU59_11605 [Anaerocolumna sp. MB42-C2]
MLKEKIINILPSCCDIGFLNISDCTLKEQNIIKDFYSRTRTIIVLAHHITTSLEWVWYPHEAERNNNTCGAVLLRIIHLLNCLVLDRLISLSSLFCCHKMEYYKV